MQELNASQKKDLIENYIPVGHEFAVSRKELANRTGIDDRAIRNAIHELRRTTPILNLQDGDGYFKPRMSNPVDRDLLRKYVTQESSRLKSIGWDLKAARALLKEETGESAC